MAGQQIDLHVGEWLVSRIESATDATHLGDIQGRVSGAHRDIIPPEVDLPAVRFHLQAPKDVRGAGDASARIMTQLDWLVVVVREGRGLAPLVPIADALDLRLHKTNGETASVWVGQCIRLEPFHLLEVGESGVHYRHAGGLYRTIATVK